MDSSRTNIASVRDNNIQNVCLRRLLIGYVIRNQVIKLHSTLSITPVTYNDGSQPQGTARTFLLQFHVMTPHCGDYMY